MKRAELPGGKILEFDDSLSDRAIEAAVRAHLGVEDEPEDSYAAIGIEELLLQFVGVAKGLRKAIDSMAKAHDDSVAEMKKLAKSNADVAKAVGAMAESVGESMRTHVRDLAQSAENAQKVTSGDLDKLSKRLYELGKTVAEDKGELKAVAAGFEKLGAKVDAAAESVTAALRAPKTIRTNKEGRPIGLDVG